MQHRDVSPRARPISLPQCSKWVLFSGSALCSLFLLAAPLRTAVAQVDDRTPRPPQFMTTPSTPVAPSEKSDAAAETNNIPQAQTLTPPSIKKTGEKEALSLPVDDVLTTVGAPADKAQKDDKTALKHVAGREPKTLGKIATGETTATQPKPTAMNAPLTAKTEQTTKSLPVDGVLATVGSSADKTQLDKAAEELKDDKTALNHVAGREPKTLGKIATGETTATQPKPAATNAPLTAEAEKPTKALDKKEAKDASLQASLTIPESAPNLTEKPLAKTTPEAPVETKPEEKTSKQTPPVFADSSSQKSQLSMDLDADFPPDIMEPIGIEESVAFALKNNFEYLAVKSRSKASRWEKFGAYSEALPSVEYAYSRGKEHSQPASYNDKFGNRVAESWHFRQDRAFTAKQPLIDLSIIADILKSRSAEKVAQADTLDSRETVAVDTINVFLRLAQARMTIQLADEYMGYLKNLMDRMSARVEGGGATAADLERIRSRYNIADAGRQETLGTYGINLKDFKRLTGITPSRLNVPEKLAPEIPENAQTASSVALKHNPAYIAALQKIDVAAADRNRTVAGVLPKMSLEYSNVHSDNAGGVANANPIDGVSPKQKDERLMLVARWSMNGGTAVAQGVAGTYKAQEMTLRAKEMRARIEQALMTGYDALKSSRKRLDILNKTLESDRRVVRDFEEQYSQGARSLFDVLDGYERRHATQLEILRTQVAEAMASYQIRRQMGDLAGALVKAGDM